MRGWLKSWRIRGRGFPLAPHSPVAVRGVEGYKASAPGLNLSLYQAAIVMISFHRIAIPQSPFFHKLDVCMYMCTR